MVDGKIAVVNMGDLAEDLLPYLCEHVPEELTVCDLVGTSGMVSTPELAMPLKSIVLYKDFVRTPNLIKRANRFTCSAEGEESDEEGCLSAG